MAEAGGKGKEMAGVVGKGKEQQRDEEGNGAETSDGVKTELRLVGDYEQGDLEVWKGSAERRGSEYQLLRDAPTNLPCLRWWLKTVAEFVVVTGLEVPKHDKVIEMPTSSWRGAWKMKALLQFQAVAHATGIMHPPRPRRHGPQQTCGEQRENQHLGSINEVVGSNEPASPWKHQAQAVKQPSTGKEVAGASGGVQIDGASDVPVPSRASPTKLRPVRALPAVVRERTTARRRQSTGAAGMVNTPNLAGWCRACKARYRDGHILHCPYSAHAPQTAPSEVVPVIDLSSIPSSPDSDDFDILAEMAALDFLKKSKGKKDNK